MSPHLLSLFRDLSGTCEKIFQLLTPEHRVVATLVLKGRFPHLDLNEGTEKHRDTKESLDLLYTSSVKTTEDSWSENREKLASDNEDSTMLSALIE